MILDREKYREKAQLIPSACASIDFVSTEALIDLIISSTLSMLCLFSLVVVIPKICFSIMSKIIADFSSRNLSCSAHSSSVSKFVPSTAVYVIFNLEKALNFYHTTLVFFVYFIFTPSV